MRPSKKDAERARERVYEIRRAKLEGMIEEAKKAGERAKEKFLTTQLAHLHCQYR